MALAQSSLYNIMLESLLKDRHRPDTAALAALSEKDWHNLVALSSMQRVAPLLWHRLKQKHLETLAPEAPARQLKESFLLNTLNNLRLNGEMAKFLAALEAENIPLIPLKGILLANMVYENIGLREMNDIDVLARSEDLQRIADILTGMGYRPIRAINVKSTIQAGLHLPGFIKKGQSRIEVHWNITHPNKSYSIKPDGLWERVVPVRIAGHKTQMLSAEDLLLHLCLHTSYLHPFTFGLRPFCDIAETIGYFRSTLDWNAVFERAVTQHWHRGIYLVLCLAVDLAGASVPDDILKALQPADISKSIMETARTQVLTDKSLVSSVTPPFAQLLESSRLRDKFEIFLRTVFLPKAVIANAYSVPMDSLRIYGCYLRRLYDVLRHHWGTFKKFQKNDSAVKALAEGKKSIADWID